MPQLDTMYVFMIFAWTWFMLFMTTQKVKTIMMTKKPTIDLTPSKLTTTLQWL